MTTISRWLRPKNYATINLQLDPETYKQFKECVKKSPLTQKDIAIQMAKRYIEENKGA